MKTFTVQLGDKRYSASISASGNQVTIDGSPIDYELQEGMNSSTLLRLGNNYFDVYCERKGDNSFDIWIAHHILSVELEDSRAALLSQLKVLGKGTDTQYIVKAPMPGLVTAIEVNIGDTVEPGKGLVILEAMKMENEIKALRHGRVKRIEVMNKAIVEKDQILVIIDPM